MNPWIILGWMLVAAIAVPFALRVLVAVVDITAASIRSSKANRRRKRANKGRLPCEYRDCQTIATRRGPGGYVCEKHIRTHLTSRGGVSFAFPLAYKQAKR